MHGAEGVMKNTNVSMDPNICAKEASVCGCGIQTIADDDVKWVREVVKRSSEEKDR